MSTDSFTSQKLVRISIVLNRLVRSSAFFFSSRMKRAMAIPNGSGEIGGCTPLGVALVVRESPASWYLRSMRYIRLSAVLLLLACGAGGTTPTSPPTPPTPVATSITLSATSLSFSSIGATQQLTATVKDRSGACRRMGHFHPPLMGHLQPPLTPHNFPYPIEVPIPTESLP